MANIQTYWAANAVQTAPDLAQLTSKGFPTNGNPAKGIPPTLPGAPWFYLMDQRLSSVIQDAGLTVDATKVDQFLLALKAVIKKQQPPAGSFAFFGGKVIPEGYLLCNGAAVSRTTYADLFEAIGTLYGAGDGSTTFNLPNAHHLFLEATTTLSEVGQHQEAGLPNITFDAANDTNYPSANSLIFSANGALETGTTTENIDFASYQSEQAVNTRGYLRFNASKSSSQYGQSEIVQPESIRCFVLIRY